MVPQWCLKAEWWVMMVPQWRHCLVQFQLEPLHLNSAVTVAPEWWQMMVARWY